MKKIFFIVAFFTAFSLSMKAQEKNASIYESAKKDALELATLVKLDNKMTENFIHLFETKYEILAEKSLSNERKAELEKVIEAKIRATLTEKQMSILEANKELFNRLKK